MVVESLGLLCVRDSIEIFGYMKYIFLLILFLSTILWADTTQILSSSSGDGSVSVWTLGDNPNFDLVGDTANTGFSVGEHDSSSENRIDRGVLFFDLPDIPVGHVFSQGTIRLYLNGLGQGANGTLTQANLYHSQTYNQFLIDDALYNESSFIDTGLFLDLITPSSQYVTFDVSSRILDDYQNDTSAFSTFRMQADGLVFLEDNDYSGFYFLVSPSNPIELVLDYTSVPEPSTYAMIFGGLVLGFTVIRKRFKR